MDIIEDKVYYHIQRKTAYNREPFWGIGQVIFIGEEKKPFNKYFDNYPPNNNQDVTSLSMAIGYYQKLIRETVFEEVREDFFPNFPSRLSCLWVIPENMESINYWWGQITAEERVILKLKLTGKIHKVNQSYLTLNYGSLNHYRQLAFRYWSGTSGNNECENEYLFEGFAEVVDIYHAAQGII